MRLVRFDKGFARGYLAAIVAAAAMFSRPSALRSRIVAPARREKVVGIWLSSIPPIRSVNRLTRNCYFVDRTLSYPSRQTATTEFLLLLRHYGQEAKPLVPVGNKEAVEEIRTLPSCD